MQLKPDCIRAILLTLEERTIYNGIVEFSADTLPNFVELFPYSLDEVLYHLKKCSEAGFLSGAEFYPESATVQDLHMRGHQFLAPIKDSEHWAVSKKALTAIRNFSLDAISSIAKVVSDSVIKSYLQSSL